MTSKKILFKISGSVAAYKAVSVISRLVQDGHEVQTLLSDEAQRFIGKATLEGISGRAVASDTFEPGEMMNHIFLDRWADFIVLCPASASRLGKMASGIGEDLMGCTFLAHDFKKPYLVFPSMNVAMWAHPSTQQSVRKLREWGLQVLDPARGALACGEEGEGRLLEPEKILEEIYLALSPKAENFEKIKVLVTAGGTEEAIDGVRAISNFSTGRTGAILSDTLVQLGYDVVCLTGQRAVAPQNSKVRVLRYSDFNSLDQQLRVLLGQEEFSLIYHAAAISDYSIDFIELNGQKEPPQISQKLDSTKDHIKLALKSNPKLISKLQSYSKNKKIKIVGFKLTQGLTDSEKQRAVAEVFDNPGVFSVVENDRNEINLGVRRLAFYTKNGTCKVFESESELVRAVQESLEVQI